MIITNPFCSFLNNKNLKLPGSKVVSGIYLALVEICLVVFGISAVSIVAPSIKEDAYSTSIDINTVKLFKKPREFEIYLPDSVVVIDALADEAGLALIVVGGVVEVLTVK